MESSGLRYFAARNPAACAIVEADGREWTRIELVTLLERTAAALAAANLAPGDAIALVSPNCGELLAAHLAGIAAGLYVVPVNWHLAEREIAYMLANAGVKALIANAALGRERLAALAAASGASCLKLAIGAAPGFVSLAAFAASSHAAPHRNPGRVLPYTSATTGRPKGVRLPLAGARAALAKCVAWHESLGVALESDNVHLCSSMLYHAAPLEGAVIALEMGHTVVLMNGWDAADFLRIVEQRRVTTTFMVPTMFVRLLKLPEHVRNGYSTTSLRFVVHGGAPCPIDVKRRMLEWWGPVIFEAYGACEAQGVMASPAEWLANPGTVGRAVAGAKIEIVGDDGRVLPPGAVGKIYLASHTGDRFEYLGEPQQTAACRRGELVTFGDRGYLNEAGFLYLVGRDSDLIISSGMNIYPAEIEQVLLAHPAVLDCAVIGVPHALCGEVAEAHVQLAAGTTAGGALTDELLRFAAARLAPMKLPRRIEYWAALPRDPNGKLLRRLLGARGERHGR